MSTLTDQTKSRTSLYLIVVYLLAVITANLLVVKFGPSISIANAFFLIGLDLTTRDYLHELWQGRLFWPKMLFLIVAGGLLSFILNRAAGAVAVASLVAFIGAGTADTFMYWLLGKRSKLVKINGSNVIGAGVDSFLFPVMAFGLPILWAIVLGQFAAKVLGGFLWSLFLERIKHENYD